MTSPRASRSTLANQLAETNRLGRDDDLARAWSEVADAIRFDPHDERQMMWLVYNGPDHDWLWTASIKRSGGDPFNPEGRGQTPIEALNNLVTAVDQGVAGWPLEQTWEFTSD
jgi:hypothetical protein